MRLASFSVTGLDSHPEPRKAVAARAARSVACWRYWGVCGRWLEEVISDK